jgi:hypothetical protein
VRADGDLAAADVGVRVDGAGHHDAALEIIFLVDARLGRGATMRPSAT